MKSDHARSGFAAIAIAIFVAALSCGCAARTAGKLTVKGGEAIAYQSGTGESMTARYYSLSDDSLSFVKVTMPDGKTYTLPNVVSASGARYTDDRELVWWTRGDTAFAEKRGPDGQWITVYPDCRQVVKMKK